MPELIIQIHHDAGLHARPLSQFAPAASLTAAGTLRILPHQQAGGTDGFFIARLVRLPGAETKVKSNP